MSILIKPEIKSVGRYLYGTTEKKVFAILVITFAATLGWYFPVYEKVVASFIGLVLSVTGYLWQFIKEELEKDMEGRIG